MKRLSKDEFKATLSDPMTRIGDDADPPFEFWPDFDALPDEELEGFDFSEGKVSTAYRDAAGRFEHVLVSCEDPNVLLVLVLDLPSRTVSEEYGLGA